MNNKGATWMEFLSWAVSIFIVVVFIVMVFGPDKLFAKTRDSIFQVGLGQLPEEKPPEMTKQRIPEEVEKYFDKLVLKIKNPDNLNFCLVDIGQMPDTKDFNIALYENRLQIEKRSERGLAPFEKKETMEGFKPCSVKGEKVSKFYDCFTKNEQCENAYESDNIVINKDVSVAPFLFKFDNSHTCFIFLDGLDIHPGCTKLDSLVDDACVEDIKRNVVDCAATVQDTKDCDKRRGACISTLECSSSGGSTVNIPCPSDMVCCVFKQ